MDREISANCKIGQGRSAHEDRTDLVWTLGLFGLAGILFTVNLGGLPLKDWDEGIVAQIARNIAQAPWESLAWLYPQEMDGSPYFNKPPLMHWLIAIAYRFWGIHEWTARLPGALLSTLSVPCLYWIGREVFFRRTAAIFAAIVYLTWLPVGRLGRLAMLDGAVTCFFLIAVLCALRSRRDLRWGLGIGLGIGLMCLTKGLLGILLGAIVLIFLAWDTPRLLRSQYLWWGLGLGLLPAGLWYGAQWHKYGSTFVQAHVLSQSLERITGSVENHAGPAWYYGLELLKYGVPWVLFLPQGLSLAWEHRNLSWAKLTLVWSGLYFTIISLMQTKLPWYVLPIYPGLALVVGAQLHQIWLTISPHFLGRIELDLPDRNRPLSRWLIASMGLLTIVAWLGSCYFSFLGHPPGHGQMLCSALALTLTVTTVMMSQRDSQFIPILLWGTYVTVLLLMLSPHWVWELAETYPVKPVAELLRQYTPKGATVYTSYPNYRPSLNFYSDRVVIPAPNTAWKQHWQRDLRPYILLETAGKVDLAGANALPAKQVSVLARIEGWALITRQGKTAGSE